MTSKILLISRGSGFMVDALKSNLRKTGFTIVQAEPDVQSIEAGKEDAEHRAVRFPAAAGVETAHVGRARDFGEDPEIRRTLCGLAGRLAAACRLVSSAPARRG